MTSPKRNPVQPEAEATLKPSAQAAPATRDVVLALREKIRSGLLVPGQRLIEADIVRELGASRSKVREALKRLEAEGLVSIEEFRGAMVRQLSMEEVRQIYTTRMVLEGMAAAEFAGNDVPKLKKKLAKLQQDMDKLENSGDHHEFARLNDAWHALITEGSGNSYIARFLSQLTVPIYRLLFSSFYSTQRIDRANADHKIITQAIVDGRVKLAEQAMRDHIKDGMAALNELNAKLWP